MHTHYVPLHEAKHHLAARTPLREQVEAWWERNRFPAPPIFKEIHEPLAVLLRQVATWRYEDVLFASMANNAALQPFWLEYTADMFTVRSAYKRALIKRFVVHGSGRNGGLRTSADRLIVDYARCESVPLREIRTDDGRSLVQVHHDIRRAIGQTEAQWDASDMLAQANIMNARKYYILMFSWFVAHAVMFEDYHDASDPSLAPFTRDVVQPAWQEVYRTFGVAPLIVRIPDGRQLNAYPGNLAWQKRNNVRV